MLNRTTLFWLTILTLSCLATMAFADPTPLEALLPTEIPAGWEMRDSPEIFTGETLFEHINGEADLFVKYGFDKSVFAILRRTNSSDDKVDIDIYDMVTPLRAFGIFSRFRQSESPAGIGLDSYLKDKYALFYKDRYFVMLQSSHSDDNFLKELSKTIEMRISGNSAPPLEIGYFPKNGLKPGSVEYYPEGLLGNQFRKGGFKASYFTDTDKKTDSTQLSSSPDSNLFLAIFDNSEQATEAINFFREKLITKGKLFDQAGSFGHISVYGADPYQGKVIVVRKGCYLVGATGFEDQNRAERLVTELQEKVQ